MEGQTTGDAPFRRRTVRVGLEALGEREDREVEQISHHLGLHLAHLCDEGADPVDVIPVAGVADPLRHRERRHEGERLTPVAHRRQLGREPHQVLEGAIEPVVAIAARGALRHSDRYCSSQLFEARLGNPFGLCQHGGDIWRRCTGEVPILVDRAGKDLDPPGRHPERPDERYEPGHAGVGGHLVERRGPPGTPLDGLGDLVEHFDSGREPGLDGVGCQDALAKAVDRRDRRLVDALEGLGAPCPLLGSERRARGLRQPLAHAHAQLGCSSLCEGDGRYRGDKGAPRGHESDDPSDKRRRLPRAGARLDEEGRVEICRDGSPGGVVDERGGRAHVASRTAAVSTSATYSAICGAVVARSHSAARSSRQMLS